MKALNRRDAVSADQGGQRGWCGPEPTPAQREQWDALAIAQQELQDLEIHRAVNVMRCADPARRAS